MHKIWRHLRGQPIGLASICIVLGLVLIGVMAPILAPGDPNELGRDVLQAPSAGHWLGTDDLGRDVLASLIHGIRVSLPVGILSAAAALLIGIAVGAVAGARGGWIDGAFMRLTEMFQVIPAFILAAVLSALSGPAEWQVIAVIAALSWPQPARVMRGEVIRLRQLDYVQAVRCLGISERRILLGEILPNALAPVLAVGAIIVGTAILLEASLAFLGLSNPDVVSWGRMLNAGQRYLFQAWWLSVFPGLTIVIAVLSFNLGGDALAAALDPAAKP
jgi:peptide/nickel transport system permease protein